MTNKTLVFTALTAVLLLSACDDAQIANQNLTKAADNFEIMRRVVFINGITDKYLLSIEGKCSINDQKTQLEVICKRGAGYYTKEFLGLSDNVTYMVQQMESVPVNVYHYRVTFKPQAILPNIDFRGDAGELLKHDDVSD